MRNFLLLLLLPILSPAQAQQGPWDPEPFGIDNGIQFHNDLDFYLNSYTRNQVKEMRKQVNLLKMSFNKVMKEQVDDIRSFSEGELNDGKTKDFTLPTVNGEQFSLSSGKGKIQAFMFVSMTNPPALYQLPKWTELAQKYDPKQVQLFVVYGKELHPGEKGFRKYKAPTTDAEKMAMAKELAEKTTLTVAVDGFDQAVQDMYGRIPNAAFVIDRKGRQIFRGTWADAIKVEHMLDVLLEREQPK